MNPHELLDRLAMATHVRSRTTDRGTEIGRSVARVEPTRDGDVLTLVERGRWRTPGGHRGGSSNTIRFEARDDCVRVSRERAGMDRNLVELARGEDGVWRSLEPHMCGEDDYRLEVRVEPGRVVLRWTIDGPDKAQTVRAVYRSG